MKRKRPSAIKLIYVWNTIGAVAIALVSNVGLANAQDAQRPANTSKPIVEVEQVEKVDALDKQNTKDSIPISVRPEIKLRGPEVIPTGSPEDPIDEKPGSNRSQSSNQASLASGWEFAFAPYLYMTGLKGTVGARGRTAEVDMSFGDVIENLNLGLMGAVEARKGRFVVVNDLMWIKLGEERDTPGQLFSSIKVGVNLFIWDPEAGYRVYESERGSFDVLGGARMMSVETNINFREGILPASDVSERKTWATPVGGVRGTVNLTPKVFLSSKFDIGGGLGADFTTQFYGGGGYKITPNIAIIGGYRYLKTDYDSEAGFLFDTEMNGILVGAKFTF